MSPNQRFGNEPQIESREYVPEPDSREEYADEKADLINTFELEMGANGTHTSSNEYVTPRVDHTIL